MSLYQYYPLDHRYLLSSCNKRDEGFLPRGVGSWGYQMAVYGNGTHRSPVSARVRAYCGTRLVSNTLTISLFSQCVFASIYPTIANKEPSDDISSSEPYVGVGWVDSKSDFPSIQWLWPGNNSDSVSFRCSVPLTSGRRPVSDDHIGGKCRQGRIVLENLRTKVGQTRRWAADFLNILPQPTQDKRTVTWSM